MKKFFEKEVDKNGDGFVTLEEINNAKKEEENRQLKEQWNSTLQTHDENKDNALQMNELEHTEALRAFGIGANSSEIMERFDANHNGQIDLNEVGLREWSKTTFYEGNATDEEKKFTLYDKNKDGKLSFQEFNVPKYQNFYGSDEQAFRDHDANTDGFVTRKEYEARQKIEDTNVAENNIYVYDINRDQKLEKNETSALLLAYRSPEYLTFNFTKFDIDRNDGLNATELVSLTENVKMNNLKYGGGDQPSISPPQQLQV
uniref:EF-hand domain-containing protein n=1 Tax=Plectus sambesii TaxID=2011161 RepID=A0A914WYC4_9BILA